MNACLPPSDPALAAALRALARLIDYPDHALRAALPDLRATLHAADRAGARLPQERLAELDRLICSIAESDALDAEAEYVRVFDSGRACALHLFEHVHGDSRERGQALVDLRRSYEDVGLLLAPEELPDYLPVVLEFASTQPPAEARAFLGELVHILNAIHAALRRLQSAYAAVIAAVVELAGERVTALDAVAEPAIDVLWEEPPAFDGCASYGRRPPPPATVDPVRLVGAAPRAAVPSSRHGAMP